MPLGVIKMKCDVCGGDCIGNDVEGYRCPNCEQAEALYEQT